MPSFHSSERARDSKLGPSGPDVYFTNLTKQVWKLPPGKVYYTKGGNTNPNRGLLLKATLAFFTPTPLLCLGHEAPQLPNASLALLVCNVSIIGNQIQMCSLCAIDWFGLKMSSIHKCECTADSVQGPSGPDGDLTNATEQESGSCLLEKYTLLSDGILAPVRVCSGKQT